MDGGRSERFIEISVEEQDSISREGSLKYIRSNFEKLTLRNIESLQLIVFPIHEEI